MSCSRRFNYFIPLASKIYIEQFVFDSFWRTISQRNQQALYINRKKIINKLGISFLFSVIYRAVYRGVKQINWI